MAATIKVTAELTRAYEIALQEADKATSVLRVFASPLITPGARSFFDLLGREGSESDHYMVLEEGHSPAIMVGFAYRDKPPTVLRRDMIAMFDRLGLGILSAILENGPQTEFESAVLDMVFQYSKAAVAGSLSDQLTYIFSALDQFLLRDASEPIQQNIAERIAFLLHRGREERRSTIKNVKDAYGLRSRFIHHGKTVNDSKVLEPFLRTVWEFVIRAIHFSSKFETKRAFLDDIENAMLS